MEEENKPSREELEYSEPLNLNLTISTEEGRIDKVVDNVYSQLSLEPHHTKNVKNNLKVLMLNLIDHNNIDKELYTAVHLGENKYTVNRYNKCNATKVLPKLVHALADAEFVEFYKGHYFTKSKRITRIRANYKLLKVIEEGGINPDLISHRADTETVICQKKEKVEGIKNKVKIPLYYDDTDESHSYRKLMVDYNNLLNRTHIDVYWQPKKGIIFGKNKRPVKINQNKKFMRRIFNDTDFETNGRFYGGFWQQLNSDWRGRIGINGNPVSEVDFSHLGISTLYDKFEKTKFKGDAYDLTSVGYSHNKYTMKELRPLLKYALMIMVNSDSKEQAIKGLRYKMYQDDDLPSESEVPLLTLMDAFARRHEPISEFFYKGMGGKQYRMDSEICAKIIAYFLYDIEIESKERFAMEVTKRHVLKINPNAKGIMFKDAKLDGAITWDELFERYPKYYKGGVPVLTVHDSFIIDSSFEDVLRWQMEAQYKLEMGVKFNTAVPTKTEWKEAAKEKHMNAVAPQVRGEELEWDKNYQNRVKSFSEGEGKLWFKNYYKLQEEPKEYIYKNEWNYIDIGKGSEPELYENKDYTSGFVEDKSNSGFYDFANKIRDAKSYSDKLRTRLKKK